jgi:transposase InsO family protein
LDSRLPPRSARSVGTQERRREGLTAGDSLPLRCEYNGKERGNDAGRGEAKPQIPPVPIWTPPNKRANGGELNGEARRRGAKRGGWTLPAEVFGKCGNGENGGGDSSFRAPERGLKNEGEESPSKRDNERKNQESAYMGAVDYFDLGGDFAEPNPPFGDRNLAAKRGRQAADKNRRAVGFKRGADKKTKKETRLANDFAPLGLSASRLESKAQLKVEVLATYENLIRAKAKNPIRALQEIAVYRFSSLSITKTSLIRWRKAFQSGGIKALEDSRGVKNKDKSVLNEYQKAFVVEKLKASGAKASYREIYRELLADMDKRGEIDFFGSILLGKTKAPFSVAPVKSVLDNYMKNNPLEAHLLKNGVDKTIGARQKAFGNMGYRAAFRNEAWEIDSSPADIIIEINGEQKRYALLQVVDVFSGRRVFSLVESSNALNLTRLFWKAVDLLGLPKQVFGDNGKDYVSEQFLGLLKGLNVAYIAARAFHGKDKPHVERGFRTFFHSVLPLIPGYIGHSVAERQSIEEQKGKAERSKGKKGRKTNQDFVATYEQLEIVIENATKRWDLDGMFRDKSPIERWNSDDAAIRKIEYAEFLINAGKRQTRICGKKGIEYDKRIFYGAALSRIVGEVEIRENIDDSSELFVFQNNEYIATAYDRETRPATKEEARAAEKAFNSELNDKKRLIKAAKENNASQLAEKLEYQQKRLNETYAAYLKNETYEFGFSGVKEAIEESRLREKMDRAAPNLIAPQTIRKPRKTISWEKSIARAQK